MHLAHFCVVSSALWMLLAQICAPAGARAEETIKVENIVVDFGVSVCRILRLETEGSTLGRAELSFGCVAWSHPAPARLSQNRPVAL